MKTKLKAQVNNNKGLKEFAQFCLTQLADEPNGGLTQEVRRAVAKGDCGTAELSMLSTYTAQTLANKAALEVREVLIANHKRLGGVLPEVGYGAGRFVEDETEEAVTEIEQLAFKSVFDAALKTHINKLNELSRV